jgi:hypothetical protein
MKRCNALLSFRVTTTIATVTCLRANQNPRIDWRRGAPPINSWVLCPSTLGDSYIFSFWVCDPQEVL